MSEPNFNLNHLILARLVASKKPLKAHTPVAQGAPIGLSMGLSIPQLKSDLYPLYQPLFGEVEWSLFFEQVLHQVQHHAWVYLDTRTIQQKKTQTTEQLVTLSEIGLRQLQQFLHWERVPQQLTWAKIQQVYLVTQALELPPPTPTQQRNIKSAAGLRAAILNKKLNLSLGDYPTLTQVKQALCWRHLGDVLHLPLEQHTTAPVGGKLASVLLMHLLSDGQAAAEFNKKTLPSADKVLNQLAAQQVGSPSGQVQDLRLRLFQQALTDAQVNMATQRFDLAGFSQQVKSVAAHCETGRFGRRKVFISHVWRKFRKLNGSEMSLEHFKDHLVEAHRQGLLQLRRADLVAAMNPEDLKASEIQYVYATFHFVQVND